VSLEGFLVPLNGIGYRHIPQSSPFGILDFRFCGIRSDGRWHYQWQPTLYLAGEQGIAITEWGRHFDEERAGVEPIERAIHSLELSLEVILDLRDPKVRIQLNSDQHGDLFDATKTRAIANLIRSTTLAQGIIVPPLGCLDKPEMWNLVVFLERFQLRPTFVTAHRQVATFSYRPL
jgi:RES domain-containing protein